MQPMLTAKENELKKVQSLERTEKQDIERMIAELTSQEAELQKQTIEFEKKELSFIMDLVALESKI